MDWSMLLGQLIGILLALLVVAVFILAMRLRHAQAVIAGWRAAADNKDQHIGRLANEVANLEESLAAEQRACRAAKEQAAELDRTNPRDKRERDLLRKERDEARAALASAHEKLRVQAARFERIERILDSVENEFLAATRVAHEGAAEEQPQPEAKAKDGDQEIPF